MEKEQIKTTEKQIEKTKEYTNVIVTNNPPTKDKSIEKDVIPLIVGGEKKMEQSQLILKNLGNLSKIQKPLKSKTNLITTSTKRSKFTNIKPIKKVNEGKLGVEKSQIENFFKGQENLNQQVKNKAILTVKRQKKPLNKQQQTLKRQEEFNIFIANAKSAIETGNIVQKNTELIQKETEDVLEEFEQQVVNWKKIEQDSENEFIKNLAKEYQKQYENLIRNVENVSAQDFIQEGLNKFKDNQKQLIDITAQLATKRSELQGKIQQYNQNLGSQSQKSSIAAFQEINDIQNQIIALEKSQTLFERNLRAASEKISAFQETSLKVKEIKKDGLENVKKNILSFLKGEDLFAKTKTEKEQINTIAKIVEKNINLESELANTEYLLDLIEDQENLKKNLINQTDNAIKTGQDNLKEYKEEIDKFKKEAKEELLKAQKEISDLKIKLQEVDENQKKAVELQNNIDILSQLVIEKRNALLDETNLEEQDEEEILKKQEEYAKSIENIITANKDLEFLKEFLNVPELQKELVNKQNTIQALKEEKSLLFKHLNIKVNSTEEAVDYIKDIQDALKNNKNNYMTETNQMKTAFRKIAEVLDEINNHGLTEESFASLEKSELQEVKKLFQPFQTFFQNQQKKVDELKNSASKKQIKIDEYQKIIKNSDQQILDLNEKVATLNEKNTSLINSIELGNADKTTFTKTIEEQKLLLKQQSENLDKLKKDLIDKESQINQQKLSLENAKKVETELKKQIESKEKLLENEIETSKKQKETFDQQLLEKQNEIDTLQKKSVEEKENLQKSLAEQENLIEELKQQISESESDAQNEIKKLEKKQQENINKLEKEKQDLEIKLQKSNKEQSDLQNKYKNNLENLENKLESLQKNSEDLTSINKNLKDAIENQNISIKDQTDQISKLTQKNKELTEKVQEQKDEIFKINKTNLDILKQNNDFFGSLVDKGNELNEEKLSNILEIEKIKNENNSKIEKLQKELNDKISNEENLKKQLENQQQSFDQQILDKNVELNNLKNQLKDQEQQDLNIQNLQNEIEELKETLQNTSGKIAIDEKILQELGLGDEFAQLDQNKVQELMNLYKNATDENKNLSNELKDALSEKELSDNQLEKLSNDYDKMKKQYENALALNKNILEEQKNLTVQVENLQKQLKEKEKKIQDVQKQVIELKTFKTHANKTLQNILGVDQEIKYNKNGKLELKGKDVYVPQFVKDNLSNVMLKWKEFQDSGIYANKLKKITNNNANQAFQSLVTEILAVTNNFIALENSYFQNINQKLEINKDDLILDVLSNILFKPDIINRLSSKNGVEQFENEIINIFRNHFDKNKKISPEEEKKKQLLTYYMNANYSVNGGTNFKKFDVIASKFIQALDVQIANKQNFIDITLPSIWNDKTYYNNKDKKQKYEQNQISQVSIKNGKFSFNNNTIQKAYEKQAELYNVISDDENNDALNNQYAYNEGLFSKILTTKKDSEAISLAEKIVKN